MKENNEKENEQLKSTSQVSAQKEVLGEDAGHQDSLTSSNSSSSSSGASSVKISLRKRFHSIITRVFKPCL